MTVLLISSCPVISRQGFVVPNIFFFFPLHPGSSVTLSSVRHACAIARKVTACSYCHWLSLSHTFSPLLSLFSFKSLFDTLFFLHLCEHGPESAPSIAGPKASAVLHALCVCEADLWMWMFPNSLSFSGECEALRGFHHQTVHRVAPCGERSRG